jgi:carbon-monoxide dehydrogenase large subunit
MSAEPAVRPNWVGQPLRRLEDERLLAGQGRYADDLRFDGEVHAVVLRSPHAHAEIAAIDSAVASAMPAVLGVFTGTDLLAAGVGPIPFFTRVKAPDGQPPAPPPWRALAVDRVRHVGDPVALVVAGTRQAAQDAAEAVAIDYRPLPAVIGLAAAAPGDVVGLYEVGDEARIDRILAEAPHVVRLAVRNNRIVVCPMEPRSSIATWDAARGELTLHCSSQAAHLSRQLLAEALGLPQSALQLVVGDVGGGFGAKIVPYPEDLLVLFAARQLGRTVRWRADRSEAFLADTQARDHAASLALALDRGGRILAYRADVLANMGGYLSPHGLPIATTTGHRIVTGVYDIPNLFLRVQGVLTNSVPTGPYRGAGRPEAIHRLERLLDVAALDLGLDAAEIRRRNLIRAEQMPYRNAAGWTYDSGAFEPLLDRALALADWQGFPARRAASEARGLLRGRGLACHIDTTSGVDQHEIAGLTLDATGRVELASGTQAIGQGLATAYAQIVADELGLSPGQVAVVQGDTRRIAEGGGTYGSRSLHVGGSAAREAGRRLREKLLVLAAPLLDVPVEALSLEDGLVRAAGRNRFIALCDLAAAQPDRRVTATARVDVPYCFPNGCYLCEVEVDPETGSVSIARTVALDDAGRIVNPMIVHGQVHGGLAQGIGQALMEEARYDGESGQLLTGSLMDYALPRAGDLPSFIVAHDEGTPTATNVLGAKGAGESGAVGAPPAVVAAVIDALSPYGVRHLDMPLTSEKVWRAMRRATT